MSPLIRLLFLGLAYFAFCQARASALDASAPMGCSFHLATGDNATPVGQLKNGQCRAGHALTRSMFTWFDGGFVDQRRRGCFWTRTSLPGACLLPPPATRVSRLTGVAPALVLQCDAGQPPDHGFTIGCDGVLAYHGQTGFYECETGEDDETDLSLGPSGAQCRTVTLVSDGCRPPVCSCSSSPPATPAVPSPSYQPGCAAAVSTARPLPSVLPPPARDCPVLETGTLYDPPRLLVPVDHANPAKAYGPSAYGQVSPNVSTVFNFDIPWSWAGQSCKAIFSLPTFAQLGDGGGDLYFDGTGAVAFARVSLPAAPETTFQDVFGNTPGVKRVDLGAAYLVPGTTYVIESFACLAGQTITYLATDPEGQDTSLVYAQGTPPVLLGLFIATC